MVRKFVALWLFMVSLPAMADVIAQVDRTRVFDDERLNLTVRVAPISPLEDADLDALRSLFDIEQQYRQERRQIINGQSVSFVDYRFRLKPRQSGSVTIPSFRVAGEQSQPIVIRVQDAAQRQDSLAEEDIILTTQLDRTEPYVDQSITLTVELAYRIDFRNGEITPFEPESIETELIDETRSTRNINGRTYNIYQRVFELTPRQPGIYSLPEIRFTAEYPNQNLGRYQRFSRDADPGTLQVRAIPGAYPDGAYWLPLSSLRLSDNLQAGTELEQGEHLDWQLQLTADGLAPEKLPPILKQIEDRLPADLTLYRNPPTIENDRRLETLALSFTAPGEYTLPEIRIPWWNLEQDRLDWATLPARRFTITPGSTQSAWSADSAAEKNISNDSPEPSAGYPVLWIGLTLLTSLGWLTTVLIWWYTRTRSKQVAQKETARTRQSPSQDTPAVQYQNYLRLQRVTAQQVELEPESQDVIRQLEAYVVCAQGTPPKRKDVQRVLNRLSEAAKRRTSESPAPFALYPGAD